MVKPWIVDSKTRAFKYYSLVNIIYDSDNYLCCVGYIMLNHRSVYIGVISILFWQLCTNSFRHTLKVKQYGYNDKWWEWEDISLFPSDRNDNCYTGYIDRNPLFLE